MASSPACCSGWRVQHGFSKRPAAKPATVTVTELQFAALVLRDLLQLSDGMAVVVLDDGRRVFAPIGSDPDAIRRHVIEREITMMIVPAGVKVHLALGYTDMRKGLDGLAALVQEHLKKDPFSGPPVCLSRQEGEHAEDPVLRRQWALPVQQEA